MSLRNIVSNARALVGPAAVALSLAHGAQPGVGPIEAGAELFCSPPAMSGADLSPDGTKLAFLTPNQGIVSLALFHLETGKAEILVRADNDIGSFFWKDDDRIIYSGGGDGDYRTVVRLSLKDRTQKRLAGYGSLGGYAAVIDSLPRDPNHIFVRRGRLAKMDVDSGATMFVEPNDSSAPYDLFFHDQEGTITVRAQTSPTEIALQRRAVEKAFFSTVRTWKWDDPPFTGLGFAADPNVFYLETTDDADCGALHELDLRTGKLGPTIAAIPGSPISYLLCSRDRSRIIGLAVEEETLTYEWLDERMRRLQAGIDASLKGRKNMIVSFSADESVCLVLSAAPNDPGAYYVLDARRGALQPLGPVKPAIDPRRMATSAARFPAMSRMRLVGRSHPALLTRTGSRSREEASEPRLRSSPQPGPRVFSGA
jgi:hypothetical protein